MDAPVKMLDIYVSEYPLYLKTAAAPQYARRVGYGDLRNRWYSLIQKAVEPLDELPHFEKALLSFTFYYNGRRRWDPDRFASMYITDALNWLNVLADDDGSRVIQIFQTMKSERHAGTRIVVADLYEKAREIIPEMEAELPEI